MLIVFPLVYMPKQYFEAYAPVLYGGSVKAENVVSYLSQDIVAGVLVGGASTKLDTFLAVIKEIENL